MWKVGSVTGFGRARTAGRFVGLLGLASELEEGEGDLIRKDERRDRGRETTKKVMAGWILPGRARRRKSIALCRTHAIHTRLCGCGTVLLDASRRKLTRLQPRFRNTLGGR